MGRDTVFLKVESRLGYDFSGDIKIGGKYTSLIEHAGLVFLVVKFQEWEIRYRFVEKLD